MLTKNDIKIIWFFIKNPLEKTSIREISRQVKIDYKLVHNSIKRLAEKRLINKIRYGKTELCEINLNAPAFYFIYVENIMANEFLEKNTGIRIIIKDIKETIKTPYYSLILFGSYAKGLQNKASDLDLLIIVPSRESIKRIESAVHSAASIKPIKIHSLVITLEDFKEMLSSKEELNVSKEVLKNHLLFYGAEAYYKLLGETL